MKATKVRRVSCICLAVAAATIAAARSLHAQPLPGERLGTVSFSVSCAPEEQAAFNRGVALLHDFWYAEAQPQFERIAKADPGCAMAHWGIAMSVFHEIWDRPDEASMKLGWAEMQKAEAIGAKTERERGYIQALAAFYQPENANYAARVTAYSTAMSQLYQKYPDDVDAGAFYALSLLASEAPGDTSLTQEHKAMAVLVPLFAKYPDHPGVIHYIIHSGDNPAMAQDALAAAERYGTVAASCPHAVHMSGHIFARLGMWPEDIEAQLGSIRASEAAEAHDESGRMDEPHSYDFLMYAYLQSGQDAKAKDVLTQSGAALDKIAAMPDMGRGYMADMGGRYRMKFPAFYALEMRDWKAAAELQPIAGSLPENAAVTWWARAIGDGHLHREADAMNDLMQFDMLMNQVKAGRNAYIAYSTGMQIERAEIAAWYRFAGGKQEAALHDMRMAADLQDKVGQAEVDIPAREMLGDMLLEFHQPQEALAEYRVALRLSPKRFNGLYHAGEAAEQAGDKAAAAQYYAALLHSTSQGADSARPELAHARSFVADAGGSRSVAAR
jgi:tetratricopeptide (TPR) repeat protein